MFCNKCGAQLNDDATFCPQCGNRVGGNNYSSSNSGFDQAADAARGAVNRVGGEFRNAINDIQNPGAYGGRLKTDRSLLVYILLTVLTCGIYGFYFIYTLARDVNTVCAGDGKHTNGLLMLMLLSLVTCGVYSLIWYYQLGNRLQENAPRYGCTFSENGTTVLLWMVVGSLLCGLGGFIAMNIIINNTNTLCARYNAVNGL